MEDSSIDSGFDAPADLKIPIGIGILGIIIGGLALIIAFVVRGKVDRFTTKVDSDIEEIHATVNKAAAEQSFGGESSKEIDTLRQELALLREELSRKFEALDQKDKALEDTIVSVNGRVNTRRPAPAQPANPVTSSDSTATASSGEYTIQGGDTFTKIAKKFGCKVTDLTDLNPDVEPARLRVGQKIKVPAK